MFFFLLWFPSPPVHHMHRPKQPTQSVRNNVPEWQRIMQSDCFTMSPDFFQISIPCIAGMCCPNALQGIAAYRTTNSILDFLIVFCCYPFVCCCYRTTIKKALLGPYQNSTLANLCSHLLCWCFASSQEYRATSIRVDAGSPPFSAPSPGRTEMV